MAKISTLKEAIKICRAANVTPFIWGHRGLGKSSLVKQVAAENGWGFIDMRCSQLEASDIRGLPDRVDGRTCYLPPSDMPIGDLSDDAIADMIGEYQETDDLEAQRQYLIKLKAAQPRFQNGILFLDEVNRAQDDVLQAIFQLILDRQIGTYVLPPGWCIVAAGNFMDGYMVTGFNDPAFLNRFSHMTLSQGETTLEEWVNYMSVAHGENATGVIEFASQNIEHLDGKVSGSLGFNIQPSRRSWEMVVRVVKACEEHGFSDAAQYEVLAGLVGNEMATSFQRYSCPVKPRNLIDHGVSKYTDKLRNLSRGQLVGLMWGMVSFCKNKITEDKYANTCLDFADFMVRTSNDKDVVVAFCRALVSSGDPNDRHEKPRAAMISNPKLAEMMAKFSKKNSNGKKTFIERLIERPELQQILAKVSWGEDHK